MARIFFVSGACGSGKTTFADAYAKHLVRQEHKTCYVIHGDDFHRGFTEPEDKGDFFVNGQASDKVLWEDILRFNWDCIIATSDRALQQNLDVVIDYVIEDELIRVQELAEKNHAALYYIVLTADADEIEKRIRHRGDIDLIGRALFLKKKLPVTLISSFDDIAGRIKKEAGDNDTVLLLGAGTVNQISASLVV